MGRIHYVVDDGLHERAKMAAAASGRSLRDFHADALDHEATRVEKELGYRVGQEPGGGRARPDLT